GDAALPGVLLLPFFPQAGPLGAALGSVLARTERRSVTFAAHRRALLAPQDRTHYLERTVSRKKRKEFSRQSRRLQERGTLAFVDTGEVTSIGEALAAFLSIEVKGWKGRSGTAAAQSEEVRRFMTEAVAKLAGEGQASVHRLTVAGKTVAATIALRSGNNAW